eukprot:TRINITY_DN8703_c0_g4_i3.p1 TRINITY_DN8703_c0_g4~~TRINITY_DN8703_c0_g4_i3.p1  ORF type:complete len:610 (+),score=111.83 TRINITY_DN8703_c0_g4_i3:82-1911(+)
MHRALILVLFFVFAATLQCKRSLSLNGDVFAFGDFDSDKHTDLFVVSKARDLVTVFRWNTNSKSFKDSGISVASENIVQVSSHDFNRDGALDVLVVTKDKAIYESAIYLGYHTKIDNQPSLRINGTSQMLVFDYNNDLFPDLLGNSNAGHQSVWIMQQDGLSVQEFQRQIQPLSKDYASAFVDMDGDCLADLVTVEGECHNRRGSLKLHVWINQKENGFLSVPQRTLNLPCSAQQITLADMDRNGAVDIVYADLERNSIHIIYNQQKPVCNTRVGSSSVSCRSPTNLCSADSKFTLGDPTSPNSKDHVVFELKTHAFGHVKEGLLRLRAGDWNMDGYPDIFAPIVDDQTGKTYLYLLTNQKCSESRCGSINRDLRTLDLSDSFDTPDAYTAAFMDYQEDGIGDLMVLTDPAMFDGNGPSDAVLYENPANSDSFFLKAMALNGLCMSWCPSGAKFPDPRPYGVNQVGATFKFTVTELDGTKHIRQETQLSQSSHMALQAPYTLYGLGRTNNYVEEFFLGMPLKQPKHYAYWIAIVPNSRLIAVPYKPSDPLTWQLELYVSPSSQLLWVSVAVLVSLVAVGLIILILEYKERKEDEAEKRATAHLFSFDAL